MGEEFQKMAEISSKVAKDKQDMKKVHEVALLEKEGKRPVTIDGKNCDHVLFLEIDRKKRVHWENWENGGHFPVRFLEIKKTEEI